MLPADQYPKTRLAPPVGRQDKGDMPRLDATAILEGLERYHRDSLEQLFGPDPPSALIDPSLRFLFLCFTNRCGSNYIARLIASTGLLNVPEEVFNAPTVEEHTQQNGLRSLYDYVAFLDRQLTRSGWLTAKLSIEQVVMLTEAGILDRIIDRTKFLLVERQDTVAQAVSRLVATQNGLWTSQHIATIPDECLVYSRTGVDVQRESIARENTAFDRFFTLNGLAPKHVIYEAVLQSPEQHLTEIGAWLGFDRFIANPGEIGIQRQESAIKQAWLERYQQGG